MVLLFPVIVSSAVSVIAGLVVMLVTPNRKVGAATVLAGWLSCVIVMATLTQPVIVTQDMDRQQRLERMAYNILKEKELQNGRLHR